MAEIINKFELAYGTMASIDILMHFFFINYKQGKTGESDAIYNLIERGTECGATGIPYDVECK